ncbi:C-type lectin domain-containing protein [Butyrivibrio sp. MC2021]|uniref:C-type lectin domain-containing protein n=1 Tax=Butyrivibrio sp. MC2021 TaxID=1408306 RepID=UPI00047E8D53|nr:C-type lectin domain-containing protein [Butyrivibrio sp. MC2021]
MKRKCKQFLGLAMVGMLAFSSLSVNSYAQSYIQEESFEEIILTDENDNSFDDLEVLDEDESPFVEEFQNEEIIYEDDTSFEGFQNEVILDDDDDETVFEDDEEIYREIKTGHYGIAAGLKEYSTGVTSIEEAEARLAELTAALPAGTYFSTDGGPCNHSSSETCDKCNYINVMKQRLGMNTTGLAGGWTCYGFSCFVYYYLFHQDMGRRMSSTDTRSIVCECPFNDVVNHAVPGDILKYNSHWVVYCGNSGGGPICYEANSGGTNIIRYGIKTLKNGNTTTYIWRNYNYAAALAETNKAPADTKAPEIHDIQIGNITADGFDVSCVVTDETSVAKVQLESWHCMTLTEDETPTRKEENKKMMESNSGRYTYHVSREACGGRYGRYQTYIYATDQAGNASEVFAGVTMLGTYADRFKDAFFIIITGVCPVGFTYSVGFSSFPDTDFGIIANNSFKVWSEKAGRDYVFDDELAIANIVAQTGGMRAGGSGDITYYTSYLNFGVSDKAYGYADGIYHLEYSAMFTDGSVLNLEKTVELKCTGEPAKEMTWNGHTYKLFFDNMSWEEAEFECERLGGHLVTITSEEEFNALTDKENGLVNNISSGGIISGAFRDYYYTGGGIDPVSGKVSWITGEESDFTAWENGGEGIGSDDHILMLKDSIPSASYKYGIWKWSNVSANAHKCGYICEIDGKKPAGRLKLNETNVELTLGDSYELSGIEFPNYANEDITLLSSDPAVVSTDGNVIKAVGTGEAVVTAWDFSGWESAECKVKVTVPLQNVSVNKTSLLLRPGESVDLVWNAVPTNAYPVSFDYSVLEQKADTEGEVISIDASDSSKGHIVISGVKDGTAKIKLGVSSDDKSFYTECMIKVQDIPTDIGNNEEDGKEKDEREASGEDTSGFWVVGIDSQGYEYTGAAIIPDVRVYYGDKLLRAGTEYSISYKNNVNVGENSGRILIKGLGAYSQTHTEFFTIKACDLEKNPLVSVSASRGSKGVSVSVFVAGKLLKPTKDFIFSEDDTTVTIEGIGNYTGKRTVDIQDTIPVSISNVVVNLPKTVEYSVEAITLLENELVVSDKNGKKLEKNKDYNVRYENNRNVGKATVYITGIADGKGTEYFGTIKKSFKISSAKFTDANTEVEVNTSVAYLKGGAKLEPTLVWTCSRTGKRWLLREGVDYKTSYAKNNKLGSNAELKINGLGCFKGSKLNPIVFAVTAQDISKLYINAADKAYNVKKKGSYYKSAPVIYDLNGKKLIFKKDYTVKYLYNEAELTEKTVLESGDSIIVEITGVGTYAGSSTSVDYRIVTYANDISKAQVAKTAPQEYTGSTIILDPFPTVTIKGIGNLEYGNDFEVVGYFNNVNKGTAAVLIQGKGAYSGAKMINFNIGSQNWK